MKLSGVQMAQVFLAALIFCLSVAMMGTAGHTLQAYRGQSGTNPWWLPLWNEHFNVRGTNSLIGSAALSTVTTLGFIILCFVPKLNLPKRPTHFAFTSILLTLPSASVSLSIVIYVHVLNHVSPRTETIQTWTCKLRNQRPLNVDAVVPSGVSNHQFARLCAESKFAHYTSLVVFLLQAIMLVGAVLGWVVDKWHAHKHRKQQWQETSSVVEMSMHLGPNSRSDTENSRTDVAAAAAAKDEESGGVRKETHVSVQPLRNMAPSRY
ncbi:hypothetical protein JOL62DRAFT_72286 [Phyllosticta paracitricarpa]|uniref:Uncharacterized protein n=2 Tax=Phyllosticta TaxID=121621 RepID=A0ABR1M7S9_9PEZI